MQPYGRVRVRSRKLAEHLQVGSQLRASGKLKQLKAKNGPAWRNIGFECEDGYEHYCGGFQLY